MKTFKTTNKRVHNKITAVTLRIRSYWNHLRKDFRGLNKQILPH